MAREGMQHAGGAQDAGGAPDRGGDEQIEIQTGDWKGEGKGKRERASRGDRPRAVRIRALRPSQSLCLSGGRRP